MLLFLTFSNFFTFSCSGSLLLLWVTYFFYDYSIQPLRSYNKLFSDAEEADGDIALAEFGLTTQLDVAANLLLDAYVVRNAAFYPEGAVPVDRITAADYFKRIVSGSAFKKAVNNISSIEGLIDLFSYCTLFAYGAKSIRRFDLGRILVTRAQRTLRATMTSNVIESTALSQKLLGIFPWYTVTLLALGQDDMMRQAVVIQQYLALSHKSQMSATPMSSIYALIAAITRDYAQRLRWMQAVELLASGNIPPYYDAYRCQVLSCDLLLQEDGMFAWEAISPAASTSNTASTSGTATSGAPPPTENSTNASPMSSLASPSVSSSVISDPKGSNKSTGANTTISSAPTPVGTPASYASTIASGTSENTSGSTIGGVLVEKTTQGSEGSPEALAAVAAATAAAAAAIITATPQTDANDTYESTSSKPLTTYTIHMTSLPTTSQNDEIAFRMHLLKHIDAAVAKLPAYPTYVYRDFEAIQRCVIAAFSASKAITLAALGRLEEAEPLAASVISSLAIEDVVSYATIVVIAVVSAMQVVVAAKKTHLLVKGFSILNSCIPEFPRTLRVIYKLINRLKTMNVPLADLITQAGTDEATLFSNLNFHPATVNGPILARLPASMLPSTHISATSGPVASSHNPALLEYLNAALAHHLAAHTVPPQDKSRTSAFSSLPTLSATGVGPFPVVPNTMRQHMPVLSPYFAAFNNSPAPSAPGTPAPHNPSHALNQHLSQTHQFGNGAAPPAGSGLDILAHSASVGASSLPNHAQLTNDINAQRLAAFGIPRGHSGAPSSFDFSSVPHPHLNPFYAPHTPMPSAPWAIPNAPLPPANGMVTDEQTFLGQYTPTPLSEPPHPLTLLGQAHGSNPMTKEER